MESTDEGSTPEGVIVDVSDYIGFVSAEGELFASAAGGGELAVDIPSCGGWDMRELVRHLGLIHLWAAGNVAFPKSDWLEVDDLPDLVPYWPELAAAWPDDADLVAWYRDTHANLVDALKAAPADVAAFTFLPAPSPLAMWARRQASEIAIHRFDAEEARGGHLAVRSRVRQRHARRTHVWIRSTTPPTRY